MLTHEAEVPEALYPSTTNFWRPRLKRRTVSAALRSTLAEYIMQILLPAFSSGSAWCEETPFYPAKTSHNFEESSLFEVDHTLLFILKHTDLYVYGRGVFAGECCMLHLVIHSIRLIVNSNKYMVCNWKITCNFCYFTVVSQKINSQLYHLLYYKTRVTIYQISASKASSKLAHLSCIIL